MKKAELKRLIFYCPKMKKQIAVKLDAVTFTPKVGDCELCGDHGSIVAGFFCKCGGYHDDIHLKDW